MNLQEQAHELEKSIRVSDEFTSLKKAYQAVESDPDAKRMFDSFRQFQLQLQQKQQMGQPITQQEAQNAQSQLQMLQQQPLISQLMAHEQRMSQIIEEINMIITKPLMDLYQPK
ncbi:YlbF family regulator [Pullulanibacillus sp. KACC 23026]|uniref:YlbF family regulator n=1 Tax=Pullulanibacillus sp. KACC 23026 TaxID=3028315 RepID=UPI0023B01A67|nr:YlbF family regulator [Pullulanibacillus sp. KACC 23026]WEG12053.1 YlbF family regulator [Pullulanibacillus sp. KACC 23026]